MWKRICAYIVGIPLAFYGILYAYQWYTLRPARLEAQKLLAEFAARENALDSLGDIDLDPSDLTLARIEERLRQPARSLRGAEGTTRVGWACSGEECAIWASFLNHPDHALDPQAVPVVLAIHDMRQRRPHRIAIGGIYLGEPIENAKQFCKKRGYGVELGRNQVTWDHHWTAICVGTEAKVDFLVFANQDLMKDQLKQ